MYALLPHQYLPAHLVVFRLRCAMTIIRSDRSSSFGLRLQSQPLGHGAQNKRRVLTGGRRKLENGTAHVKHLPGRAGAQRRRSQVMLRRPSLLVMTNLLRFCLSVHRLLHLVTARSAAVSALKRSAVWCPQIHEAPTPTAQSASGRLQDDTAAPYTSRLWTASVPHQGRRAAVPWLLSSVAQRVRLGRVQDEPICSSRRPPCVCARPYAELHWRHSQRAAGMLPDEARLGRWARLERAVHVARNAHRARRALLVPGPVRWQVHP